MLILLVAGAYLAYYVYPAIQMVNKLEHTPPHKLGEVYDKILASNYYLNSRRVQNKLLEQGEKLWWQKYFKEYHLARRSIPPWEREDSSEWKKTQEIFQIVPDNEIWKKYLKITNELPPKKSINLRVKFAWTSSKGYDVILPSLRRDADLIFKRIRTGKIKMKYIRGGERTRQIYHGISPQKEGTQAQAERVIEVCEEVVKPAEWRFSPNTICFALMDDLGIEFDMAEWMDVSEVREDRQDRMKRAIERLREDLRF